MQLQVVVPFRFPCDERVPLRPALPILMERAFKKRVCALVRCIQANHDWPSLTDPRDWPLRCPPLRLLTAIVNSAFSRRHCGSVFLG